jgi:plastocyanin
MLGVREVTVRRDRIALQDATLDAGDRYAFKFGTPGTYTYFCSIHSAMKGLVIVR